MGCSPIIFQWKCRCHQDSIISTRIWCAKHPTWNQPQLSNFNYGIIMESIVPMTHVPQFWVLKSGGFHLKTNGCSRLKTLVICLGQLLASKIHIKVNWRNKITKSIAILHISILLHGKNLHRLMLLHIHHIIFDWSVKSALFSSLWCTCNLLLGREGRYIVVKVHLYTLRTNFNTYDHSNKISFYLASNFLY